MKQINFITGGPPCSGGPGAIAPVAPPQSGPVCKILVSDSLLRKDFYSTDNGIHLYARKFCRRPTSEGSASEQSRCSASVEYVLCWCTSEASKYSITSAVVMAAAMTSCSSTILGIERLTSAYVRQVYE